MSRRLRENGGVSLLLQSPVRVPMSSELLLIHATGVCALALNVVALVRTCEKALRIQSGLAGVIWALNNLLLGAHTAAALSLVSAGAPPRRR